MSEQNHPTRRQSTEEFDHHAYKLISLAAVILIGIATIVYTTFEQWSFVDSLYFSVVAVTTVGFGDLVPSTDVTKLFTVVYLISGVSLFATYLNLRTRHRQSRRKHRRETRHTSELD